MSMTSKDGRLESPTYLSWVRRQPCRWGEESSKYGRCADCSGPIDPHHVEGKGMGGARCRDDRTVPLCRSHHDHVHATSINADGMIKAWADETMARFVAGASVEEIYTFFEDVKRWKGRPLAVAW